MSSSSSKPTPPKNKQSAHPTAHSTRINPPLGPNTSYCMSTPTTLVIKNRSLTRGAFEFTITDDHSRTVFSCRGHAGNADDLQFGTVRGQFLYNLRTKLSAGKKSFSAVGADGRGCFEVRRGLRGEFSSFYCFLKCIILDADLKINR